MKTDFDERQLQIRGKVFFHGFITTIILLLINAFLHSSDIVWASGFHQNVILMVIITTIVTLEAIIRGVYFGNGKTRWIVLGVFGSLSLLLLILTIQHILHGTTIIEDAALTSNGFSLALAVMFTLTTVVGIVVELKEKRRDNG